MAQGFKPSKAGKSKGKGSEKKAGPKRGKTTIAPKKKSAIEQVSQKRKQTASLTRKIEADMAGRASGGGPLTIMKKMGDEASEAKAKEKEQRMAKAKAKGRA